MSAAVALLIAVLTQPAILGLLWAIRRLRRWQEVRAECRDADRLLELMRRYDLDVDQALERDQLERAFTR